MFSSELESQIACGLDYGTACAFLRVFSPEPLGIETLDHLRHLVDRQKIHRSHFKASHVKAACIGLRAYLRTDERATDIHFGMLDILEAYAAPLAARKLSELLRIEAFDRKQIAIPWR